MTRRGILKELPPAFHPSALPQGLPEEGEVVIVVAPISKIESVPLPPHELEKAAAAMHPEVRNRYLAGRYLIRGILGRWLDLASEEVPLALTETGKPFLKGEGACHLSLSHTEELVGVVFSLSPVGIDLEKERDLDVPALAKRFFSPEEASLLGENPCRDQFFRLWCCREAVAKADGRGLGALLSTMKVAEKESKGGFVEVSAEGQSWKSQPWILPGQIHGSVAFRQEPRLIRWCEIRDPIG